MRNAVRTTMPHGDRRAPAAEADAAGRSAMPRAARWLAAGAVALGVLAAAAVIAESALPGIASLWAASAGWALGGLTMLTGTLAAALRLPPGTEVRRAYFLFAAGALCWVAGAGIRLSVQPGVINHAAGLCWIAFTIPCIASYARRLPRLPIFGIFLLEAIPAVLLVVAIVRTVAPEGAHGDLVHQLLVVLYPALYVLLAACAVEMALVHRDVRRIPASVWLFTIGFCLMAVAALVWVPQVAASLSAQGHVTDPLWTLGLVAVGAGAVRRAWQPSGYVALPGRAKEIGPHALPAAAAILGLIILLVVVSSQKGLPLLVFLLVSALALTTRVLLIRRDDLRLLADVVRSRAQAETAAAAARDAARRLTAQNERLRELDRMKDEFIAVVSHELRTPLTSIIGYLELLTDEAGGPLTSQQRQLTSVLHRNSVRLLHLVGDLLFLGGLQTGQLKLNGGEADLPGIARRSIGAARQDAERKQVTLSLAAGPVPGLRGDQDRLAQLLDNLLANAIKFTPPGGQVTVTLQAEAGHAVCEVTDTGIGIPAADQPHVFERFYRAGDVTEQAIPGSGLGLTISKAIVDAHGGAISVESEAGRGTTIRVRLPLRSGSGRSGLAGSSAGSRADS